MIYSIEFFLKKDKEIRKLPYESSSFSINANWKKVPVNSQPESPTFSDYLLYR